MALTPGVCSVNDVQGLRKNSTFHQSLWGDYFLAYQPPTAPKSAHMTERFEVLKEQVRKMLESANEIPKILDLIVKLQRLGLDNHYENEIDIFLKFKGDEGDFCADDIKSLLSLYNAAYLRTQGDKVLDEAIIFARGQLEVALDSLESTLADEVSLALQTPLFRRVRILETRNYIPIYERETARNEAILELAKLNFNLLQLLYCEELKNVTQWWKQFNVETNLSFIRDRIVEMHFWMTGACSETKYSLSRVILTKMAAFITILDDIMDTYSTTEEGLLLAEAIYRCEENAVELLPEYMKGFYMHFLKTFDSLEDELVPNRRYRVFYLKEVFKMFVRGMSQEIWWRDEDYVPETINEHLELSGTTVAGLQIAVSSFVGMGDIITKEVFDWLLTYPKLIKCFTTITRLSNDIASTKREQTGEHYASTVQCYMLQHGTTMDEACEKIRELIEDSWKDMMQVYITPTKQPKVVAETVVDFARTVDYIYKKTDAYTFSHTIKDMIVLLYIEPTLV